MSANVRKVTIALTVVLLISFSTIFIISRDEILLYKTWHSNVEVDLETIEEGSSTNGNENLNKIVISGNFKYFKDLSDNVYFYEISVDAYDVYDEIVYSVGISTSGKWKNFQNYLILEVNEEKTKIVDIISGDTVSDTMKLFLREMAINNITNTKYIKPINENVLLMVSINNSTSIWSSVKDI